MMGQKLVDEIADCGSFFDHVDELLNFAVEDVEASLPPSNGDSFTSFWPTQSESIPCSDSVFASNSDLSAELSVPYEEIVQLEWLSTFVEDSFSGQSLMINKLDSPATDNKYPSCHQLTTSSPVSVLDSSSSCSGSGKKPESATPKGSRCGRARSKRPCRSTFSPRPPIQILPPGGATIEPGIASPEKVKIPNKKIKLAFPLGPEEPAVGPVRKCLHCEVTETPQWRAGPMGPKTLCNACGVRYKSGRLFPEYRPAASPTFIPALHSNSHRKVLEMRSKGDADLGTAAIPN